MTGGDWRIRPDSIGASVRLGESRGCPVSWVKPPGGQRRVEGFVLDRIGDPPARVWRWDAGKEIWPMPSTAPVTPSPPSTRGLPRLDLSTPRDRGVLRARRVRSRRGYPVAAPRRGHRWCPGPDRRPAPRRRTLIVVEFAWDRIDGKTVGGLWRASPTPLTRGSLVAGAMLPREGARRWRRSGTPARRGPRRGAGEEGLHCSGRIREGIGRRFVEQSFSWGPPLPGLSTTTRRRWTSWRQSKRARSTPRASATWVPSRRKGALSHAERVLDALPILGGERRALTRHHLTHSRTRAFSKRVTLPEAVSNPRLSRPASGESLTRHRARPRGGHRLTGCGTVAVKRGSSSLAYLTFYLQNSTFWRAYERTRTASLLFTSDHSGVAGGCTALQFPHS